MNPYLEIRHLAAEIEVGINVSTVCPFCSGGSSREKSFSITRSNQETCLFICYRASCSKKGKVAVWGYRLAGPDPMPARGKPTASVYTGNVSELGEGWISELRDLYGLTPHDTGRVGWGEDLETGHLVIPIRTRRGIRCGTETRRRAVSLQRLLGVRSDGSGDTYPKTKNYFEDDSPRQNWIPGVSGVSKLVIVEDSISALKTSRQFPCVSILGTHLNIDRINDIVGYNADSYVIALDNDATAKAIGYKKKFGIYGNFKVAMLSKDLKYENNGRIKEIIEEAK